MKALKSLELVLFTQCGIHDAWTSAQKIWHACGSDHNRRSGCNYLNEGGLGLYEVFVDSLVIPSPMFE
jgi:hypothetical protein